MRHPHTLTSQNVYILVVTDEILQLICSNCPQLEKLDLQKKFKVTGQTIQLEELAWLNLNSCLEVNSQGFQNVIENCKKLKYLDISECKKIEGELVKDARDRL